MPTRALLSWTALTLAAAFAAVAAPLWTYAVSLALFGLPHVLVELRYVDRAFAPGLGRRMVRAVLVGLGAIALLRGMGLLAIGAPLLRTQAELGVGALLAGLVVWFGAPLGSRAGLASVLVAASLAVGVVFAPVTTLVVFAFAHNLTPLGFLAAGLRGPHRTFALGLAGTAFLLIPLLIVLGWPGGPSSLTLEGPPGVGPIEQHLGAFVPPAWQLESIALDLFSAAAYLQCMHYAVVLCVLPGLAPEPRSGARVAPTLLDEVGKGPAVLALGAVATVGFALAFGSTRASYGVVAAVHAWVEVPVLIAALAAVPPSREAMPA
ncbi:MAG: hypothetical protein O3C51_09680 [Planctomycetota bacterium]|nr:hypothetical protein [Planctomycetota bacterium]